VREIYWTKITLLSKRRIQFQFEVLNDSAPLASIDPSSPHKWVIKHYCKRPHHPNHGTQCDRSNALITRLVVDQVQQADDDYGSKKKSQPHDWRKWSFVVMMSPMGPVFYEGRKRGQSLFIKRLIALARRIQTANIVFNSYD
jgi:hypothetical protein